MVPKAKGFRGRAQGAGQLANFPPKAFLAKQFKRAREIDKFKEKERAFQRKYSEKNKLNFNKFKYYI